MQIFEDFVELKDLCLGLGFFDGVHVAHQAIIKDVVKNAKENGLKSAIITFERAPLSYLNKNIKCRYLENNSKKAREIEELGVDYLFFIDFEKIKNLEAIEYLELLHKNFSPKFITTGFNNNFGVEARGDAEFLRENEERFGYKYHEIPPQMIDSHLVSSSEIRNLIKVGAIEKANEFLGRDFSIFGVVQVGNMVGRTINFPTINILWEKDIVKLPYGVYKGFVKVAGVEKRAVINWGYRPTIDNKKVLEAYILDFEGDLYGQEVEIGFKSFVREQMKFPSVQELKEQIEKDILH